VLPAATDAARLFGRLALDGAPVGDGALLAPGWDELRALVAGDPNAVAYLPLSAIDASVKPIDVPVELRALVAAVAASEPAGPARGFLAWAQSAEGQGAVARRHEPL
jgi:hypothetical protein